MAKTNGFKVLEGRYGIKVVSEGHHMNCYGKMVETFAMYTADGCCWEKGLSRSGVKAECLAWEKELIGIKKGF